MLVHVGCKGNQTKANVGQMKYVVKIPKLHVVLITDHMNSHDKTILTRTFL